MSNDDKLELELVAHEKGVWDALVRGDIEADAKALANDFLGVYPDGFSTKEGHVQQLADGPTVEFYRFFECRARPLGKDHGILSYRADFQRPGQNSQQTMYVSSIWQRAEYGWVNIFSQDTPGTQG